MPESPASYQECGCIRLWFVCENDFQLVVNGNVLFLIQYSSHLLLGKILCFHSEMVYFYRQRQSCLSVVRLDGVLLGVILIAELKGCFSSLGYKK